MSEKNNKLYFGNLSYSVTSQELQQLLSEWAVEDCRVIEGKGFGFVTFKSDDDANNAKEALNGQDFKGRNLRIDFARESKPRTARPRY
jgi:RNA recognition motif-containing protein